MAKRKYDSDRKISIDINKRYPKVFKMLEEYDKTHKLRKERYKKKIDLTIDSQIWNKFRAYCKEKNVKMSNVVENLIKKEIE